MLVFQLSKQQNRTRTTFSTVLGTPPNRTRTKKFPLEELWGGCFVSWVPCPSFPCFSGIPCFFSLRGIPCFFERFSLLSRDFRGSVGIQNPCFFGGFPCLFPKKQGKEGQGFQLGIHRKLGLSQLGTVQGTVLGHFLNPPFPPNNEVSRRLQRHFEGRLQGCLRGAATCPSLSFFVP